VGNTLLEKMSERQVYAALIDGQGLQRRLPHTELKWLLPKIDQGVRLHHSFHVFNVFTRTGHHAIAHTLHTMDECRISWGKVLESKPEAQKTMIRIKSQKLIYEVGQLKLVPWIREVVVVADDLKEQYMPGDWVSVHWGFVCDRLTLTQVQRLRWYTRHHLQLANHTL